MFLFLFLAPIVQIIAKESNVVYNVLRKLRLQDLDPVMAMGGVLTYWKGHAYIMIVMARNAGRIVLREKMEEYVIPRDFVNGLTVLVFLAPIIQEHTTKLLDVHPKNQNQTILVQKRD